MNNSIKIRKIYLLLTVIYGVILYLFYFKYVPLVESFQMALLPILLLTFILNTINIQWGTLFFVFSFPLINNLPYIFGIYEHIPHAPTALVLFLFYFLGWLAHNSLFRSDISFKHRIFKPIILFSIFIFISGIITFFRYANFYPFLSDHLYELITNVNEVTAGGAIMSSVFNSLNYLSGFAFFFILLNVVKTKEFTKKILIILLISTFFSLSFGFYQHFRDPSFGNTPIRVKYDSFKSINSTLKDPNSFGVFLAVIIPLLLGMILFFKKFMKIVPLFGVIGAFFILPHTGSLSGLLGAAVSLLFFLIFAIKKSLDLKKLKNKAFKKIIVSVGILLFLIGIFFRVYILLTGILHPLRN